MSGTMVHFVGQPVYFVMMGPQVAYAPSNQPCAAWHLGPASCQSSTGACAAQQFHFAPCAEDQPASCAQKSAPPSKLVGSAVVVTPENVRELASHPEGTRTVQRAL